MGKIDTADDVLLQDADLAKVSEMAGSSLSQTQHYSSLCLIRCEPETVDARCSYSQGMGKMGTDGDILLQNADLAKLTESFFPQSNVT